MTAEVEKSLTIKTGEDTSMISRTLVIQTIRGYPLFEHQKTDLFNLITKLSRFDGGSNNNKLILATLEGLNVNIQNLNASEKRRLEDSIKDFGITDFNLNELFKKKKK